MKKFFNRYLPLLYGAYFNMFALFDKNRSVSGVFDVFCKVRGGRVEPKQMHFLTAALMEKEVVGDNRLQSYIWPGKKPTVLLIHGWESNSFRWRNVIEYLQEADYNVIAFDAPGHGYSTGNSLHVPRYVECLHHMIEEYRPRYLVGHSVGGMTALYHQYLYPDSVIEKIVTIGSPAEFYEIMNHFQGLLKLSDRIMSGLNDLITERFGLSVRGFSSPEFVKSNKLHGLILHDRLDTVAPFQGSEKVHKHWKNSQFVITEGFGHSMHQDEVNMQIINFLDS